MFHELPKGVYSNVQPGLFGLVRYTRTRWEGFRPVFVEWYHCRESFQYAWNRYVKRYYGFDGDFFFCCPKRNLETFLRAAEKALGLWKKTKVYKTHVRGICCVVPAKFWQKQDIRMSLFTILLRAAENYRLGSDWQKCLMDNPYAQETKEAIARFFDGNTVYKGRDTGWCHAFSSGRGCLTEEDKAVTYLRRPRLRAAFRWCLSKLKLQS